MDEGIGKIPVFAPFRHIASHVVESQFVGFERSHRLCGFGIVGIPSHFVALVASREGIRHAPVATTCGIFPLRLRRQAELLPSDGVQFLDEFLAVFPGHIFHGQVIALETRRVVVLPHHRFPQCLSHFRITDSETGHRHIVTRLLVHIAILRLLQCGTHEECATLNTDHIEFHLVDFKPLCGYRCCVEGSEMASFESRVGFGFGNHGLGNVGSKPKPCGVVAFGRSQATAVSDACAIGSSGPAAPTHTALHPSLWSMWISLKTKSIVTIPVGTPLCHVARHIEQTDVILFLLSHGMSRFCVGAIPCHIFWIVASSMHPLSRQAAPPGGILPLRLRRQTEGDACCSIQFLDKFLTFFPCHVLHRCFRILEMGGIVAHHGLPQLLGDFGLTNQERADRHSVCRFLIRRGSVHLVDGFPHDECSSLHTNHVERDLSHFHLTIVGEYITKLCKRCVHRCFLRRILRNCTKRRHHQRHQTIINTIHIGIKTYR